MRLLFFDLGHYIASVLLYWWATPFAALVAGGVAVFEKIRGKSVSRRIFIGFAIAYLVVAGFSVWREEHNARVQISEEERRIEKEQKDAKDQNTPNLQGDVLYSSVGELKDDPNITIVTFIVSVTNLGAPSITKNWWVSIKTPDREFVSRTPIYYRKGWDDTKEGEPGLRIQNSDAIYARTGEDPIPRGGEKHGNLVFLFKGVKPGEIGRGGNMLKLCFSDATGKQNFIIKPWPASDGKKNFVPYVPGLHDEILPAESPIQRP
jgi:hypothetical protein